MVGDERFEVTVGAHGGRATTMATEPRRVMVDGEDAMDAPITVRGVPHSLRVLVPADG